MAISISIFLLFLISSIKTETLAILDYNVDFIKTPYFVDKSELFLEIFRSRCGKIAFITIPPKFGKTTNLQMLKKLIQFELDFDYRPKPMRRTSAYHLVHYLKLSQHEEAYSAHLAQHPVILFDLKYDVDGEVTHEKLVTGLASKVQQTFKEYDWLTDKLQSTVLHHGDLFQKALQANLSEKELLDSLVVLSEILYKYFNESKVVLLVDNFDYTSKYDFVKPYVTDPLYFMIHSIILNVTKSPYCVKRSLILSVSDRKVSAPLYGNIRQFPFLEEDYYAPFFGILPTELDLLFERYRCSEQEKINVKKWYAGYETNLIYRPIYNTYSIVEYYRHRNESNALRPYWASAFVQNTAFITQFLRVTFFRTAFNELLRYGTICSRFRKRRLLNDKKFLPNMTKDNTDVYIRDDKIKDLVGLLFEQGYLCHRNYIKEESYKIPNLEIENLLVSLAIQFYQSRDIPVTNVSFYLLSVLEETESSTASSEWNVLSMIIPIQRARFNSSTEFEYFNIIHLASLHIKLTVPGTEIIIKWLTSTAQEDIVFISNGKAMMINMDSDSSRIVHVPPDPYVCGCIQGRNISTVRLLSVRIKGPNLVKCQVRTVKCDSKSIGRGS
ncbi:uncharacterized protein LOC135843586 [Planococcus citri]|uniref:uncharacterized protein LOC135843586 n=1 Tax=Planococcus citri TaxID=170843 RepID=UPI0031F95560